jgi:PAS domain S-box-containing protein
MASSAGIGLNMDAMTDTLVAPRPAEPARPDFEALFRAIPSPYMVLDRQLRFVEANDAYCAVTERAREELVGQALFEMFPNTGEGGRMLAASLAEVLQTGRPHSIPLIPYPIPLPKTRGGGFEMRYWSAVHTPLNGPDGRARYIIQNTVDVTELQQLKAMAYGPGEEAGVAPQASQLLQRTQEVARANELLAEETRSLRDLFLQAPGFMAVLTGDDLVFTLANDAYQALIGRRAVIGRPICEALPEIRDQGFENLLRGVMTSGQPYIGEAAPVLLQRTPGAPQEERFLDFIYQPMRRADDGRVFGVFVQGADVTDRVRAEARQKLLLDELNHRVKNTLATVQAIAAQTIRGAGDPKAFLEAFESRLIALSATHDLLTDRNWASASLRDVVAMELRPYAPDRYRLEGPEVELKPAAALALGLLFHELATNAAKYGALGQAGGGVELGWSVAHTGDGAQLVLDWVERGGPPVAPPTGRGFGSRLIERSLNGALGGRATLDFAAAGLRCRVELPMP